MKVLFLCHDPPAPVTNGGAMDMLGMCQSLHDLGHTVDLAFTVKSNSTPVDEARLSYACNRYWKFIRNTGARAAMSRLPYQISSRHALMTHNFSDAYDVVIASDHCSGALFNPHIITRHWILRRNNIEQDYAIRMAADSNNAAQKLFFYRESHAFNRWHKRIDSRVDQIWYVSTEELKLQSSQVPNQCNKYLLVPSALGEKSFAPVSLGRMLHRRVLYFGSMTVPINRKAVDWFVREVHPQLLEHVPGYNLVIAGRVDHSLGSWVSRHLARKDYSFIPSPEDADAIYQPGGIFVDPLAHDAGIKLKILEAVRRGYAVVCSPESLYGSGLLPGEHALTAVGADKFFKAVEMLLIHPGTAMKLIEQAQEQMQSHFDIDRTIREALALLND